MKYKKAQVMTYIVNTIILFIVFLLAAFFYMVKATFLVYFSIPTAVVYIIGYVLAYKEKLTYYVWSIYIWLTLYMCISTVCLGLGYGFQLYCMSMIPVMFVTEYMGYKLEKRSLNAVFVSILVGIAYLLCTGYVSFYGPVYKTETGILSVALWVTNSIIVICFLIFYSNWVIKTVIKTEKKLIDMANTDRLTGLFNRRYMMESLSENNMSDDYNVLAMADIDHFKVINDTYGHSAGDAVLSTLAEIIKDFNKDYIASRWGGEEFLFLTSGDKSSALAEFEELKKLVENYHFMYDDTEIKVTITIGVTLREDTEALDSWIQRTDANLYYGKNNGRNMVVFP